MNSSNNSTLGATPFRVPGGDAVVGKGGRPAEGPACGIDAGGLPPGSNTGGKLTTPQGKEVGRLKIDWLTLVYPAPALPLVLAEVSKLLGAAQVTPRPLNLYRSSHRWECGAMLAFSEEGLNHETCCLVLSGSVLDFFTPEQVRQTMRWSALQGASCSRLDLAFDDFTRQIIPLDKIHAAADGGHFAGFKRHRSDQEKTRRGELLSDGHTFGLRGKNGGGRLVNFYDKTLESRGEIDAIRMETRFSKELAHLVFSDLVAAPDHASFVGQIAKHLGGSIDFVDRGPEGAETHLDRCPRLPWWGEVLDLLGSLRLSVFRSPPPLQQALEYMRDTWSGTLAIAWEVAESQGLNPDAHLNVLLRLMVDMGKQKLSEGWRPGARDLGLDYLRLLTVQPKRRKSCVCA